MGFKKAIVENDLILCEAAVIEAAKRSTTVTLHPLLENALLIYDKEGRQLLSALYREYISVAHDADLPIVICTPTWRASHARISDSGVREDVNGDLIGYQANASSLGHTELDHSKNLQADDVTDWGSRMLELHRRFGVKILGGCCGTNADHLRYITENLNRV